MPHLSLHTIADAIGGEIRAGDPDQVFESYHFDSRLLADRGLFFALRTDAADGHDYIPEIARRKGCGAIVASDFDTTGTILPIIAVDDSAQAYVDLACWVRSRFDATTYIAITGSAGKTTTRQFTQQILSSTFKSYEPPGNWNNWLGVSFALLNMPADAETAVFELAMSYPGIGEIERLARILRPRITCLLNALPTHLEFLKTVENVAIGKLQINSHLGPDGIALIQGDDPLLRNGSRDIADRRLLFGHDPDINDATLSQVAQRQSGTHLEISIGDRVEEFEAGHLTASQVENLFAAILICLQAGMNPDQVRRVVPELEIPKGRGRILRHRGWTIVDDTYNSNPAAVRALLKWAAGALSGHTVVVLGDMLELGEDSARFHREIGRFFASLDFDQLVVVGALAENIAEGAREADYAADRIMSFANADDAGRALVNGLPEMATVVLKGSRGIALDRTLALLTGEEIP